MKRLFRVGVELIYKISLWFDIISVEDITLLRTESWRNATPSHQLFGKKFYHETPRVFNFVTFQIKVLPMVVL